MKNGQKSSLYGETSLYSEEIPYSELFLKIHYIEYPLYTFFASLGSPLPVFKKLDFVTQSCMEGCGKLVFRQA